MTEQELRDRLNSLTEASPDETHRSFLMAASPGKDEIVMVGVGDVGGGHNLNGGEKNQRQR